MLKWLIVAALVAGSVGFVWTAPWKDEVDAVRAKVSAAATVLDDLTKGDCADVAAVAGDNATLAVEQLVASAPQDVDAKAAARRQADQIAACIQRLPRSGAGWKNLEQQLRAAAG